MEFGIWNWNSELELRQPFVRMSDISETDCPKTPKRRGSTACPSCEAPYQNNAVPPICTNGNCAYDLGEYILIFKFYVQ